MNFGLTQAQLDLAARVRQRAKPLPDAGEFPPGLFAGLAAEGLFALGIPAEYGGSGADAVTIGVALEELAGVDLTPCYAVLNAALIGAILTANGTPEQRDRWLPPIAAGDAIVALCLTEPDHGTDAASIELRADRDDDGGWRLTGVKTSTMLGKYATHALVFGRTGEAGARGISAFYTALDGPAVVRTPLRDLGSRAGGRSTLAFDGLPVAPGDMVGAEGQGFIEVMRGFDYSRALISLMAVGVASAALNDAVRYARDRHAFGQPIGRFQGVAFPLAEHAAKIHMARLLAYEALSRKDAGLSHRIEANMAKWWAPKAATEAVHQALLTFGHHGWSEDLPLARRLRDVIGLELADGSANTTKLVISRELLGCKFAP